MYLKKYGTARKLANVISNKSETMRRKSVLRSMPYKVTIDPGNFCNLRCPGCHTGIKHPEMIKPTFLKLRDYKTMLSPFEDYVYSVALYNWGEPFLNKEIFDIVAHTTEKGIGTTVHSNFNHFNEKMAEDAVRSGLTHIYLSIDGATQEAYEQYRQKGDISRVVENLHLMLETRKRLNSIFPIITWKFLKFDHNRHEVELARELANLLEVDDFEEFEGSPVLCDIYDMAAVLSQNREALARIGYCRSLWNSVYINSDGTVFPCSLAFRPSESFGNILNQPFSEIWNNENYRASRRMTADPEQVPLPCKGCAYFLKCQGTTEYVLNN